MKRLWIFLTLIWRESPGGGRVSIATAWSLAKIWTCRHEHVSGLIDTRGNGEYECHDCGVVRKIGRGLTA